MNVETKNERHVVLIEPEVHWNTGNIGRTCLGANATLHLIKPLGFSIDSKQVKRAGLDYWHEVSLNVWNHFEAFIEAVNPDESELAFFAKSGKHSYLEIPEMNRLFLVFGSETKGLPERIRSKYHQRLFHIPVSENIRCLNLSTAAGIALYSTLQKAPSWHQW